MKILAATLFIALAVFPNSVESSAPPTRPPFYIDQRDYFPQGLYWKDADNNIHPLPRPNAFYEFRKYYLGRVEGEMVKELYNGRKEVIFHEKYNDDNQVVVGPEGAQEYGIPGTIQSVNARIAFLQEEERRLQREERTRATQAAGGRGRGGRN